jgi:hypothetical protein
MANVHTLYLSSRSWFQTVMSFGQTILNQSLIHFNAINHESLIVTFHFQLHFLDMTIQTLYLLSLPILNNNREVAIEFTTPTKVVSPNMDVLMNDEPNLCLNHSTDDHDKVCH